MSSKNQDDEKPKFLFSNHRQPICTRLILVQEKGDEGGSVLCEVLYYSEGDPAEANPSPDGVFLNPILSIEVDSEDEVDRLIAKHIPKEDVHPVIRSNLFGVKSLSDDPENWIPGGEDGQVH